MTYLTGLTATLTTPPSLTAPGKLNVGWQLGKDTFDSLEIWWSATNAFQPLGGKLGEASPSALSYDVSVTPIGTVYIVALPVLVDNSGNRRYVYENNSIVGAIYGPVIVPAPPNSSPDITSVAVAVGSFTITWDAPGNVGDQWVRVDDLGGNVGLPKSVGGAVRSYTFGPTVGGASYEVRVQAYRTDYGKTPWSPPTRVDISNEMGSFTPTQFRAGAFTAVGTQINDQRDVLAFDESGCLQLAWPRSQSAWYAFLPLTAPYSAPSGAPLATAQQPNEQLSVFWFDGSGRLCVDWVVRNDPWNGVVAITQQPVAPPGARLVAASQPPNEQLTCLYVGNGGDLCVTYEVNNGPWHQPVPITLSGYAPPGASLAAFHHSPAAQLDVVVIDSEGRVSLSYALDNAPWDGQMELSPGGFAPPGGGIAAGTVPDTDDHAVFVVAADGALYRCRVHAGERWGPPERISNDEFAPPGAQLAFAHAHSVSSARHAWAVAVFANSGALYIIGGDNAGNVHKAERLSKDGVGLPGMPPAAHSSPTLFTFSPGGVALAAVDLGNLGSRHNDISIHH